MAAHSAQAVRIQPSSSRSGAVGVSGGARHSREVSLAAVGRLDLLLMLAGPLLLLLSFGGYYTYTLDLVSVLHTASTDAWSGTFGGGAAFLGVAASALLGAGLLLPALRRAPGLYLAVLIGNLAALGCVLAALVVTPRDTGNSYVIAFAQEHGHGLCYWLSLLVVAFSTTLSAVQLLHHRSHG